MNSTRDQRPAPVEETLPAEERRAGMLEYVEREGFASITGLAALFEVSAVTVRSDLDALEESNAVRRVRGGVLATSSAPGERSFEEELATAADEKEAIATEAAGLVRSGQSVILDVGTTTAAVARALVRRSELHDVTIITNGLAIALQLESAIPRFTVVVTGGTLRPLQHSLVEPLAADIFARVRADIAFIGCTGVDAEAGVTNVNLPEATLKRAMLQAAARGIVVADHDKLGMIHLGRVGGVADFDTLITGDSAADRRVRAIEAAGIRVVRASYPFSDENALDALAEAGRRAPLHADDPASPRS